jgi:hypothetical protein
VFYRYHVTDEQGNSGSSATAGNIFGFGEAALTHPGLRLQFQQQLGIG